MPIVVRTASEADLPGLMALYAQLHPDDEAPPPDSALDIWRVIAMQAGRAVLVASLDGVLVGTVDTLLLPNLTRGGRPFLLIENVVVDSVRRRAGVGSALLAMAETIARRAHCYKIQLLSRDSRVEAHAFYEAHGFGAVARGYRKYLG